MPSFSKFKCNSTRALSFPSPPGPSSPPELAHCSADQISPLHLLPRLCSIGHPLHHLSSGTSTLTSFPQAANKLESRKSLKNKRTPIFHFQLPSYLSVVPFTKRIESVACIVVSATQLPSPLSPWQYSHPEVPLKHHHWVTNSLTTESNLTSCM